MPAVSETALAPHHDESLSSTARAITLAPDRYEREAAVFDLRHNFCAQLRAARERRGIDLQSISGSTKVSEGLFADLERGDLSRWPTGIYRRAFFREYAAFIGLPGESTVSEFVRLFPEDVDHESDALMTGPLRLTLARPFWLRVSWRHLQAAGLDLLLVALGAAALAVFGGLGPWTSLAIVGVAYQLAATTLVGGSFGRWLMHARSVRKRGRGAWLPVVLLAAGVASAQAQSTFQPEVGQPGKDVVWVPTPQVTVERMLDLAQVTPADFVIDLGSGDGRNIIAAARRGASGLGVEYNPDMVALSKRLAEEAGVSARAQFVQGDMFEADISKANVLALFLLPSNMLRLRSAFYGLAPGARIVSNTFTIQDWDPDETVEVEECDQWCTVHLYVVPAKIDGEWRSDGARLLLKQEYQMLSGTLTADGQTLQVFGQLRGTEVSFKAGGRAYSGHVGNGEIAGTVQAGETITPWRATR